MKHTLTYEAGYQDILSSFAPTPSPHVAEAPVVEGDSGREIKAGEAQDGTRRGHMASFHPKTGARACHACGSGEKWKSIHGSVVCERCHPPADEQLVVERIGGDIPSFHPAVLVQDNENAKYGVELNELLMWMEQQDPPIMSGEEVGTYDYQGEFVSYGISGGHPRFQEIMKSMEDLDVCLEATGWDGFLQAILDIQSHTSSPLCTTFS